MRKSERLLNLIVMLLETPRPVTAEQIHRTIPGYGQDAWDSFKRMFERDKEELREMGIPLELTGGDAWDTDQGYRIPKDRYYLPDLDLAPDEVAALWLAAGLVRMNDPGPARSALMKLTEQALPRSEGNLSWLTADMGLTSPNMAVALDSVAERKEVAFAYRGKQGVATRSIRPYGLTHRKGRWYLVGHDGRAEQIRSFRLDRVEGAIRQAHPSRPGPEFSVPEDFHLEGYLERPPFVQGEALSHARVRFDPSTAWWVERSHPWLRLEQAQDHSATALVEVADDSGFVSWLLGFGQGAEVLEPQHLRDLTRARLEQICG
ncbi:MAG: helix-turn-helix transcriptional regulator [Actinomycetota bacterium]